MEIWKDIPGYEGIYQASTLGQIRTCEGKITSNKWSKERHWKSRIMKGRGDNPKTGRRVTLWKNGEHRECLVARLVATTFLGPPAEGHTVNHKDGNRMNNAIENLEWLTLADNIRHGFRTGLYPSSIPIVAKQGEKVMHFESMASFDVYIGRAKGYTSGCLARHKTIKDSNNNQYEVEVEPF